MSKPGIVIHCSDLTWGSSIEIDSWHRARGWENVGYHFVICNGFVTTKEHISCMDGSIERGRQLDKPGAHALGYNDYIGICLIGVATFTDKQFESLAILVKELVKEYSVPNDKIIGHYAVSTKTCPNFDVEQFLVDYNIRS